MILVVLIRDDKHGFCVIAGNDGSFRAPTNGYFRLGSAYHAGDNSPIEPFGGRIVHRSQQTPRVSAENVDGFQKTSSDPHRRQSLQKVPRTTDGRYEPASSRHIEK